MAKVTITIEDITDEKGNGIKLKVGSSPAFPGPEVNEPLTKSQELALEIVEYVSKNASETEHKCDSNCKHEKLKVPISRLNCGDWTVKLPMLEITEKTKEECINKLLEKLNLTESDIEVEEVSKIE